MKRLLLVTYYYPPLAGAGVFRPLRLSRYLPEQGWQVTVLSVHEGVRVLKDPGLVREVPAGVRIERTRSLESRNLLLLLNKLRLRRLTRALEPWLNVPDDQRGWVPFAVRRGLEVLGRTPHDAVLTTSSPYSAHLVGRALRRRTGVPWVADFRDEWTSNPYLHYPTAWHRRLNRRLEHDVLTEADRVVCVSTPWLEAFRARTPGEPAHKFRVMPNGYDAEHFRDPAPPPTDRFRVVYTGSFYGPRSPRVFLEAVQRVIAAGRVPAEELEVLVVGHTGGAEGLSAPAGGPVRIIGQRPFHESLDLLRRAAVLLLVIPPEGGRGNHTGKLFPYLAARRAILALAPEPNVAAELIRRTRSGVVVPPGDREAVAGALERLYARWKTGGLTLEEQDRAEVERYEARPQTAAYAACLDELAAAPRGSRPALRGTGALERA